MGHAEVIYLSILLEHLLMLLRSALGTGGNYPHQCLVNVGVILSHGISLCKADISAYQYYKLVHQWLYIWW